MELYSERVRGLSVRSLGMVFAKRIGVVEALYYAIRYSYKFCCMELFVKFSARTNTLSHHARPAQQSPCPAKASKNADSLLAIVNHAKDVY